MKFLIIFFSLLIGHTYAQKSRDSFFKGKSKLKNPFSLRDPFKAPIKKVEEKSASKNVDGVFTNVPTVENIPLANIQITGVFLGKERRAVALINNKDSIILKEGMKLGADQAELKAILPGGVVLVEKIINVYGQEEYLETIIPITGK